MARVEHAPRAEDFLDAVDTFARAVRRARGVPARPHAGGLTLSQYGLLVPLLEHGSARVSELARLAGVTSATATRVLDPLERCGAVCRTRSDSDRRAVSVSLTAQGRQLLQRRDAATRELERCFYAGLEPRERAVAPELLRKLAGLIDDIARVDQPAESAQPALAQGPTPPKRSGVMRST